MLAIFLCVPINTNEIYTKCNKRKFILLKQCWSTMKLKMCHDLLSSNNHVIRAWCTSTLRPNLVHKTNNLVLILYSYNKYS